MVKTLEEQGYTEPDNCGNCKMLAWINWAQEMKRPPSSVCSLGLGGSKGLSMLMVGDLLRVAVERAVSPLGHCHEHDKVKTPEIQEGPEPGPPVGNPGGNGGGLKSVH